MAKPFIHEMHYFRIPVTNLQASITWYTECLGFQLKHSDGKLAVIELSSGPLLILIQGDPDSKGHFTINGKAEFSIGFTTSAINELYTYLKDQNVKVDDMQEDNGHSYFHFYDPSGNKLQVHN
ncbi:VOC family protein [Fictibacillus phosphorivorans]|uniref:VOC family protein n=1 Tax=Fictibacillus phosphorivorans TaxID=1221500 RepID=UPI00203BDB34|nr:VOC family protein [Fictibacillus phosphorivorans]MCM3718995.1 VOC family protein [Fictibacillus phosphorivorans]MCM3776617.1 VOC family protein [Fictibacillus phosphorivorans]